MTDPQYRRLTELFEEARSIAPDQRNAWLDDCASRESPDLVERLRRMLEFAEPPPNEKSELNGLGTGQRHREAG